MDAGQVRRYFVVPLMIATVALSGAATAKRADSATPVDHFESGAMANVKAASRTAPKPKKRMRSIQDDDLNKDLDKLDARIRRLWLKVENLETRILQDADTTPEREGTNA